MQAIRRYRCDKCFTYHKDCMRQFEKDGIGGPYHLCNRCAQIEYGVAHAACSSECDTYVACYGCHRIYCKYLVYQGREATTILCCRCESVERDQPNASLCVSCYHSCVSHRIWLLQYFFLALNCGVPVVESIHKPIQYPWEFMLLSTDLFERLEIDRRKNWAILRQFTDKKQIIESFCTNNNFFLGINQSKSHRHFIALEIDCLRRYLSKRNSRLENLTNFLWMAGSLQLVFNFVLKLNKNYTKLCNEFLQVLKENDIEDVTMENIEILNAAFTYSF